MSSSQPWEKKGTHPDMFFLKNDQVGNVLAMGLAELYKQQPSNPVDFYAKWLLNYEKQRENHTNSLNQLKQQKELSQQVQKQEEERINKLQVQEKQIKNEKEKFQKWKNEFAQNPYPLDVVQTDLCEFIKQMTSIDNVYIGQLEFPTKPLDSEDKDAHLDLEKSKTIQYIATSNNQTFLLGQQLPNDAGVTYDVFKQKSSEEGGDNENSEQQNYVFVDQVVNDQRIHYFQIPRLGSYIALPFIYNSSLNEQYFDTAIEERLKFRVAKPESDANINEREQTYKAQLAEKQEAQEDTQELTEQYLKEIKELEVHETPFQTIKKEYVLCLDNLGQDKIIDKQVIQFLQEFVQFLQKSIEETEHKQFSEDLDIHIINQESINNDPQSILSGLNQEEVVHSERNIDPELKSKQKLYEFELEYLKLEKINQQLRAQSIVQQHIQHLVQYQVLKFSGIYQGVLYMLGYTKEQINIAGTNRLNWPKMKQLLMTQDFYKNLNNLQIKGEFKGEKKPYQKVRQLIQKFEGFQLDIIENYNIGYSRLLKWAKQTMKLRLDDIEIRRQSYADNQQLFNEKTQELEKWEQDKQTAKQSAIDELPEEERANFKQEEWEATWTEQNPRVEIPQLMEPFIDLDLEDQPSQ